MTGTLAQLIALTAFGNSFFKTGSIPLDFNDKNSTFQYCNKVDFREVKKKFFFSSPKEVVVAPEPISWLKYLHNQGCKHLRLYYEHSKDQALAKDHKLAGMIGGGGLWLIEAIYNGYSNYWAARWEVTNKEAKDYKIWSVEYILAGPKLGICNRQIDHQQVKDKLAQTLTAIADFAFKHNLRQWGEIFDKAKSNLNTESPSEIYYHKDMIPVNSYSLPAKQILFAASTASVFGGMGSWNDMIFDDQEVNDTYEKLSVELYDNINDAFISAINSF